MCSQRTHTYTQHSILHSLDYFVLFCFFWVRTLASTRDANKMIWKSFVSYVDTVHGVPSICIINWNLWCCVCVKKQRCLVYKKRVGTQRRIELCAVGSSLLVLRGTLSCVVHGMAIRCRCLVVRIRIIELSRLPTNICAVKKARCVCANRQGRCRHITAHTRHFYRAIMIHFNYYYIFQCQCSKCSTKNWIARTQQLWSDGRKWHKICHKLEDADENQEIILIFIFIKLCCMFLTNEQWTIHICARPRMRCSFVCYDTHNLLIRPERFASFVGM